MSVVFTSSSDPVKLGLVASFNGLGGNLTGVQLFTSLVETGRLELLRQLLPADSSIPVQDNSRQRPAATHMRERVNEGAQGHS